MNIARTTILLLSIASFCTAADNQLTEQEREQGWILLFDGTLKGWMTNARKPSLRPVEDGCINPHRCGEYMMIHEKEWSDFVLSLDFKISNGCNSGIFLRTYPLAAWPEDVGMNGIEVAVDDTTTAGFHDTGALYDLVKPKRNVMKPVGLWNRVVITCDDNIININLNNEDITQIDLDEWTEPNYRPDCTFHKYEGRAFKNHPRHGYIGLQDHGSDCWYKNIKLMPLNADAIPSTRPDN
jgi:hypothetical protein